MDLKPKTILRRVFDFARTEIERRSRPPSAERSDDVDPVDAPEMHAGPERSSPRTPAPVGRELAPVLDVARTHEGVLRAQWSVASHDVARAEPLLGEQGILCLRMVSFASGRDDVRREVFDRPFVPLSGACDLGSAEVRGVISVGLRAGERFVSIVHHIV
jgi:hypothetical protein